MKKFAMGFAVGLAVTAYAPLLAAQMVGGTGYLIGWTVTKGGEEICYMPYIWTSAKEIECD